MDRVTSNTAAKRPAVLVRAARALIRQQALLEDCLTAFEDTSNFSDLMTKELEAEKDRKAGAPTYDINSHISLLAAVLVENAQANIRPNLQVVRSEA